MPYHALFERFGGKKVVRAGLIGSGHFGTAILTQSVSMPLLQVPVIAERNLDAARAAFVRAGFAADDVVVCEGRAGLLRALEAGRPAVTPDAMLLMGLPLDVVVEATGSAEAGARHALEAIRHGKHVAMVSKEPDSVVGPILHDHARRAGVVYTPVDGDQHGLLIEMVEWARLLGLEVLCGGKARDAEFVHDFTASAVRCGRQTLRLEERDDEWPLASIEENVAESLAVRCRALAGLPQVKDYDVCEIAIAANATGLMPDTPTLHHPPLRIPEIPSVLCPVEMGGILRTRGAIETVTCLREEHEPGMGGGVFLVVGCANDYSRHILTTKGLIPGAGGQTALIYRPHHLCGVESPLSLLYAGLLGVGIGGDVRPRVDMVARAPRALPAGTLLGVPGAPELDGELLPAARLRPDAPLPFHLLDGRRLLTDVPAGTLVTGEMVEPPAESVLWELRREQDARFLGAGSGCPEAAVAPAHLARV